MKLIEIPENCPACESKLVKVNDQLFCRSLSCPEQSLKKIEHFAKTLKIKGLGPATITSLGLESITDIYSLNISYMKEALGEKVSTKLMAEINNSLHSDFKTVLAAMSIPLIGGTASEKIAKYANSFEELNQSVCSEAGLGEKASYNLMSWIEREYKELDGLLPFVFSKTDKPEHEVLGTVCITGKLRSFKTKKEAAEALEAKGYQYVENLTKTVTFLVDEGSISSTKRTKADSYGIAIIADLETFLL